MDDQGNNQQLHSIQNMTPPRDSADDRDTTDPITPITTSIVAPPAQFTYPSPNIIKQPYGPFFHILNFPQL